MKANLLNTLILALSVSTILITLMSYLIFKIRQFPKNSKPGMIKKTEGIYFKRYVPKEDSAPPLEPGPTSTSKLLRYKTLPYFFGLIFFIVSASFFMKDFLHENYGRWVRRGEVRKLMELKKKGLFQIFELDKDKAIQSLEEYVPGSQRNLISQKLLRLKNKRIALVGPRGQGNKHVAPAMSGWKNFLKDNKLTFTVTDNLRQDADIYILPHWKSLGQTEVFDLEALISKGKGILLTGPCGVMDKKNWCEGNFGFEFVKNQKNLISKPTIFADSTVPGWSVPPGFLANWYPEDEEFLAIERGIRESILQSEFDGKVSTREGSQVIRGAFRSPLTSKIGWLALEPHGLHPKGESDSFYGKSILIETLYWLSGETQINLATWKDGKRWALSVSVDSEDKIEGAYELQSILKSQDVPATFFIVSEQLERDDRLVKSNPDLFDIGSHSKDHTTMKGKDLEFQFHNIQESRLYLEEKFERRPAGFHPPHEQYDEITVNAIGQNQFSYFAGDQRIYRLSPLFLTPELVYFPRVLSDDILIQKNRGLITDEDIFRALKRDSSVAKAFGGIHYLNIHSQTMGQGYYLDIFEEFLRDLKSQNDVWVAHLSDVSHWWRQRNAVEVKLLDKEIILENPTEEVIKSLVVYISGKPVSVGSLAPGGSLKIQLR